MFCLTGLSVLLKSAHFFVMLLFFVCDVDFCICPCLVELIRVVFAWRISRPALPFFVRSEVLFCFHVLIVWLGLQHCSGINCLTGPTGLKHDNGGDYLFSGSQDGTLKRWELGLDGAVCGATFESHIDWNSWQVVDSVSSNKHSALMNAIASQISARFCGAKCKLSGVLRIQIVPPILEPGILSCTRA